MREAVLVGHLLQPFCLAYWVRRIPAAFDVHGFDNVMVADIRQIIFQQVVLWQSV